MSTGRSFPAKRAGPVGPDSLVRADDWSALSRVKDLPHIEPERLRGYRLRRLRESLHRHGAALGVLVSPISLRYALDYRSYLLWQAHAATTYAFVPQEGPVVAWNVYGAPPGADECRVGRANTFFDGGANLGAGARMLADDVVAFLREIGSDNRRIAVEYVNPSLTLALLERGLEVIDGVVVSEEARLIKSEDEIACMRWAIAVAELGIGQIQSALRPGVTELQLWGLLNYTNIANDGDWHNGRMLASGPRINPWLQEASARSVEAGDLVGLDTDMVGPFGYFADVSRTFHCGPGLPSRRQRQLYQLARAEIEHNLALIKPGITLAELQRNAFVPPEEFHANAYPCILHGVGMTDEFPRVNPGFRGPNPYDGALAAGMTLCVESYIGAEGERDGVKLEQQIRVTDQGHDVLTSYPLEDCLLD